MNTRTTFFIACLSLVSSLCAMAGDLPVVNIANGTSYALLEKSGLNIVKGQEFPGGGRGSDSISDKEIRVTVAPGKSFTLQSDRGAGLVGLKDNASAIEFYEFDTVCATLQDAKAKIHELGAALGFDGGVFGAMVENGDVARRHGWATLNDKILPCWAVEVQAPPVPELPYRIAITFVWDKALFMKMAMRAYAGSALNLKPAPQPQGQTPVK